MKFAGQLSGAAVPASAMVPAGRMAVVGAGFILVSLLAMGSARAAFASASDGYAPLGPRGTFDWYAYGSLPEQLWSGRIELWEPHGGCSFVL